MPSPNRDKYKASGGKMLDENDSVFDLTAWIKSIGVTILTAFKIKDSSGVEIDPATKQKQDEIKEALNTVGIANTEDTRINPATEDKQLPDNHQVAVSNPTANPETGLAKEGKQTDGSQLTALVDPANPARKGKFDTAFQMPVFIDLEEYKIHKGSSHYTERFAKVNTDELVTILAVTPDTEKFAHIKILIESTKGALFELFESSNSAGGTALITRNRNRNMANGSAITITHTPSAQTSGTLLQSKHVGSAGKYADSGEARSENEWILKRNTTYLLRATSHEDANEILLGLNWYEHTDE